MNILLFGGGLQVLTIARSLKSKNYVVDVIGMHNEISRKCRYVRKCYDVDLKTLSIGDFVQTLNEGKYAVVIPMEDDYATWLSIHKDEIHQSSGTKCAVMDYGVYALASDKTQLLEFCKQYRLPHPKTALINGNYNELAEEIGFPALIKPSHSAGSRGIHIVNSVEELMEWSEKTIAEYGECALQEYICSKDYYYNVMLYRTADGNWGNYAMTKIMRYYPIKGGSSSFCVSIENDKLLAVCKEILDKLGWVGFADFDVLEKGDGDYRVIEINPRIPASVRAAAISGVDFGEMIVKDILGEGLPVYTYTPGMQLRCLGLDIAWFLSSPNRWKCKPSWFKFFGKKIFYQEGGSGDSLAMCTSIWMGIKKQLDPSFRKQKSGMN